MAQMRISCIIPSYNRADLISETLRSVLNQTRPPHEVIVVDDGSTDGSTDVIAGFGSAVKLIRQANAGAGPARNAGFAASTGDIVHFMDSDDISSLNSYAIGAAAIEAGADMTYGPWLKTRFEGNLLSPDPVALQQGPVPGKIPLDLLVLTETWGTVFQPCLFHRSLIERAGPYRSDLKPSEDYELLYRILMTVRAPVHTPEPILLYRVHPENQVSEQNLTARMIDRANLWSHLQNYRDARTDVGTSLNNIFKRKKWEIARELRIYDEFKADAMQAEVGIFYRALRPVNHFALRVKRKLKRMATGNPYAFQFAASPLRDDQRDQIGLLGYILPERSSRA